MAMEMRRTVIVRDFAVDYLSAYLRIENKNMQSTFLCHFVSLEWIEGWIGSCSIDHSRRPRNCSSRS